MTAGAENHCKKCGHIGAHFIPEPEESLHNGKVVCGSCGAFIRYEGKPKTDREELGRWAVYDVENTGTEANPVLENQDWRFNFGKYNGQRIREVIETDKGFSYCRWLCTKTDFDEKCPRLIDLIEEIAEEEGIVLNV